MTLLHSPFMASPIDPPKGTDPVVFKTPTLGNAVRLGELYDQRSGQFLGVQLYSEETVQTVETNINHTDLTLSLSTTLEEKASLLDIYGKLSLEILSGAVSVSGSASYVKDTKSNTHEQAFALALKIRLDEKRILFAEDAMGRNVLRIASEDYIANGAATHFVSAIVFGGNLVINLVAKQSELSTEEKIEGQLEAKFNKLKGAISLEGEVRAEIKDTFKSMDDKFDVIMHGDIALDQVPIDPKDVLEAIPNAASLIRDGGGVPISVTLQPIPKKLVDARKIYEIDERFVDEVMKAFSELDDLRSRFAVLVDGTKSVEEFVPELARIARATAVYYADKHGALLYDLRNFLDDYQHGKDPGARWKDEENDTFYIPVLRDATNLRRYHLELEEPEEEEEEEEGKREEDKEKAGEDDEDEKDKPSSDYYPTTLVGLENELLKFQYFVADLHETRDSAKPLEAANKKFVFLSSLDTILRAIRHQNVIPLFVMPPFTLKQPGSDSSDPGEQTPDPTASEKLSPDLAIIQFLTVLRENIEYFNNSQNPARILYAETLENLNARLPGLVNDDSTLRGPLVIGNVNVDGTLAWSEPPPTTELHSKLDHKTTNGTRGYLSYGLSGVNGKRSFTFQVHARAFALEDSSTICILYTKTNELFLTFQVQSNITVRIQRSPDYPGAAIIRSRLGLEVGKPFVATLTQDFDARLWTLYIGNTKAEDVGFVGTSELLDGSEEAKIVYSDDLPPTQKWWKGEVFEVRGFSYAFTPEQLEAELMKGDSANSR